MQDLYSTTWTNMLAKYHNWNKGIFTFFFLNTTNKKKIKERFEDLHWKGESYRKPGSLLRKRVFLSKNKIILLRRQSTHSPTCTRTGPDLICTKLMESSPGQSSFLPPSEAFWNVSSLYDQTAKHLCSPTTPLIRICSLETKTEKGIGKGLRHQLSPVFPESQKHNALQQALKSDRVTGKWWTWTSPHHGGGNVHN